MKAMCFPRVAETKGMCFSRVAETTGMCFPRDAEVKDMCFPSVGWCSGVVYKLAKVLECVKASVAHCNKSAERSIFKLNSGTAKLLVTAVRPSLVLLLHSSFASMTLYCRRQLPTVTTPTVSSCSLQHLLVLYAHNMIISAD